MNETPSDISRDESIVFRKGKYHLLSHADLLVKLRISPEPLDLEDAKTIMRESIDRRYIPRLWAAVKTS
jgi:hypothetical protein